MNTNKNRKTNTVEKKLISTAAEAMKNSYSPYSKFPVGAAILCGKTGIFSGTNVENASYGLTICAERSALDSAVSAGHRKFSAIAIISDSPEPVLPCGACLQVLGEFCEDNMPVICTSVRTPNLIIRHTLKELMPKTFKLKPRDTNP